MTSPGTYNKTFRSLALLMLLFSGLGVLQAQEMRFENAGTFLDDGVYYMDAFAGLEIGEEPELSLIHI